MAENRQKNPSQQALWVAPGTLPQVKRVAALLHCVPALRVTCSLPAQGVWHAEWGHHF